MARPSAEKIKAAAAERLSTPMGIGFVLDKNGKLKSGSQEDVDRFKKNQQALAALEAGDEAKYDKIMKELYG